MPRRHAPRLNLLSPLTIKNLKTPGRYTDGGGLYLLVDPQGNKRWIMRIMIAGVRRDYGLGPLHKVSIERARDLAEDYRRKLFAGEPVPRRRRVHPTSTALAPGGAAASAKALTFERAADEVHRSNKAAWKNGKHVDQWINTLSDYAFPIIGAKPVAEITTPDVLAVLTPIWLTKPETARRVRQRIKSVLEWARAAGHRSGDNPVDLIGKALPKNKRKAKHHAALPFDEVNAFIKALHASKCELSTKLGLEFLILTALRSHEVRGATWSEFDLVANLWTIPAARMKVKDSQDHVVPLSPRARAILDEAKLLFGESSPDGLVFPDPHSGRQMSENRFLNARDTIGYGERCTPHGFRSSFRDWAAETTNHQSEVVEMALAHAIKSDVEAAYRRGVLLAKRRTLMNDWADYVAAVPTQASST